MKKIISLMVIALAVVIVNGCRPKTASNNQSTSEMAQMAQNDTTTYGIRGEGTSMHHLELITDMGDTLHYTLLEEGPDSAVILGGLLCGDRLAVIGHKVDGESYANRVINLTTLQGKWISIDKQFEILEGGIVKSSVKAEQNPWTEWRVYNGQLLLNRDTFAIDNLGADSLYLENKEGIFAYHRLQ